MALPASSELSGVKTGSLWRVCCWALGQLLALAFAGLVLSTITFWRPAHWNHLRWLGILVVLGFAYNGASCLEAAVVNSLEVGPYITAQMYATLLTQLLALWLILEFVFAIRQRQQRHEAARASTP